MGSAAAATNAYDDDDDHDDDDDEDPSCFNVNYTGGYGFTALALAARNGHLAVVQVLLADTRVAVDYRNKGGSTPLMEASGNGRTTIAVVLLLAGADIDAADTGGHTALEHAKCGGHGTLTAVLEAAASPPLVPGMPLSAQWWAAGVVFLPPHDTRQWHACQKAAQSIAGRSWALVVECGAAARKGQPCGQTACVPNDKPHAHLGAESR